MSSSINGEFLMADEFKEAHTTGLFTAWKHPHYRSEVTKSEGTFDWVMRPVDGVAKAKFYTD